MAEPSTDTVVRRLIQAIVDDDADAFARSVVEDAVLRLWRWDGRETHRPRQRIYDRLRGEWSAWDEPVLDVLIAIGEGERASVEYRVWTTEGDLPVEHNRVLLAHTRGARVTTIDLYCAQPVPTANHAEYVAEQAYAAGDVERLFAALSHPNDTRRRVATAWRGRHALDLYMVGNDDPHPGSNFVRQARFTTADADRRVAEVIDFHRRREIGFCWLVGPCDTPADLGDRLERRGLVRAGDAHVMACRVHATDRIAVNPDVTIEVIDPRDEAAAETSLQIVTRCFQWPPERADQFREYWYDSVQNPRVRAHEVPYLAYLEGKAVGWAKLRLKAGLASLEGAATLPAYRSRRVYASLLRRRLEDARARGRPIVCVEAQPMSRRVLARHGFETRATLAVYAWMPVIDMDVIGTLMQRDDNQPE